VVTLRTLVSLAAVLAGSRGFPESPLAAQGLLLDARMEAVLPSDPAPVEVRLTVRVLPGGESAGLPLTLLTADSTRVEGLTVDGTPLQLVQARPHYWTALLPLPGRGNGAEGLTLELAYAVHGAWGADDRITLPVPAPAWIPRDPQPRTFVATVAVPPGLGIVESFPTSVTLRPHGTQGGDYQVRLQSVPSMLILRMARGKMPLLTVERFLDLSVLFLRVFMGFLGIRYLRREEG
jgi:hypothetical protein